MPHTNRQSVHRILAILGGALAATVGGIAFWAAREPSPVLPGAPVDVSTTSSPPPAGSPPWFEDVTPTSGIDFTCRTGAEAEQYAILESLGGGVALFDYDGDGLLDVFVIGGGYFDGPDKTHIRGSPCKLYRNLGGFRFEDVTAKVGLDRVDWWYTHGAAVADYDRDGWPDLLVTGYGRVALFHNEPDGTGGRKFVDVSRAVGLADPLWSTSAGWADIDGDGFPDLYVCHYCDWSFANHPRCGSPNPGKARDICSPTNFKPLVHGLFKNEGGKLFRNVSAEHGLPATGYGLGVVLADVNADGRPDAFVGNDIAFNFLFLNQGGRLAECGFTSGVAVNEEGVMQGSMGMDVGDYDGSGRASLWTSNYQNVIHGLYRNLGNGAFRDVSRPTGIGALSRDLVGFGTGFIDADNDGWEDLVIAHGHVLHSPPFGSPVKQRPIFLRNTDRKGQRFFLDHSQQAGPFFGLPNLGRGLAIGDLDNDGWPDVIISHSDSRVAVLKNKAARTSPARWLGVKLVGKDNRDVVGSTVTLDAGRRTLTRFTKGGGSYLSANDPRIIFGLGTDGQVGRLRVRWSWGHTQTWDGLTPGAYWELREGEPAARRG